MGDKNRPMAVFCCKVCAWRVQGIFALAPVAGGWSLLQVAMLWFGIMGAGLANLTAGAVVDAGFLPTPTMTGTGSGAPGTSDTNFVRTVFLMEVCVAAHNAMPGGGGYDRRFTAVNPDNGAEAIWDFGSATQTANNNECGRISIPIVGTGLKDMTSTDSVYSAEALSSPAGSITGVKGDWSLGDTGAAAQAARAAILAATKQQFIALDNDLIARAGTFIDGGVAVIMLDPNSWTNDRSLTYPSDADFGVMTRNYYTAVNTAVSGALKSSNMDSAAAAALKSQVSTNGFTTLGGWYMSMARESDQQNSLAKNVAPRVSKMPEDPGADEDMWKYAMGVLNNNSRARSTVAGNDNSTTGDSVLSKVIAAIPNFDSGAGFVSWFTNDSSGRPILLRLKNLDEIGRECGSESGVPLAETP